MPRTDKVRRNGAMKCRELPVSVECPVSAHQSALNIKRAVFRTRSANRSRESTETDISERVKELCPHKSTCRFDLAARDVMPDRTTRRAARHYDNHIDISYSCQSSASAIIQPTSYRPGNSNDTSGRNTLLPTISVAPVEQSVTCLDTNKMYLHSALT